MLKCGVLRQTGWEYGMGWDGMDWMIEPSAAIIRLNRPTALSCMLKSINGPYYSDMTGTTAATHQQFKIQKVRQLSPYVTLTIHIASSRGPFRSV